MGQRAPRKVKSSNVSSLLVGVKLQVDLMLVATLAASKWELGLNHAVQRLVPPTAWRACFHQVLLRAAQTALITNGKLTKQRLVEYVAKATAIVAPTVTVACTGQLRLRHHQRPCGLTWLTAFAIVAKVLKS